ncbi:MAG: hypothetical protein NTW19_16235 [Planctomycetota bacterium]|nr:hypothetical protein [Planctomycetota bacterium]
MPAVQVEYAHADRFTAVLLASADAPSSAPTCRGEILDGESTKATHTISFGPDGLRFEARVHGGRFSQPHRDADIWRGDCLQLGLDPAFHRTPHRHAPGSLILGLTQVDDRPYAHAWKRGDAGPTGAIQLPYSLAVDDQGQTYRAAIPWAMLPPLARDHGQSLGFSLSVNAHDTGEARYHTWAGGIIGGQDSSKFGVVILDRLGLGVGAEAINREPADSYDPAQTLQLEVLVPVVAPANGKPAGCAAR